MSDITHLAAAFQRRAIQLDLGGKATYRANEHFIYVSFALMRAIGLTHDNGIVE